MSRCVLDVSQFAEKYGIPETVLSLYMLNTSIHSISRESFMAIKESKKRKWHETEPESKRICGMVPLAYTVPRCDTSLIMSDITDHMSGAQSLTLDMENHDILQSDSQVDSLINSSDHTAQNPGILQTYENYKLVSVGNILQSGDEDNDILHTDIIHSAFDLEAIRCSSPPAVPEI